MFLFFVLQTLDLPSLAKGVKPGINRNDVYALEVSLPPLDEQKRIVALLDAAKEQSDRVAAYAARVLECLAEMKASVLRRAFEGAL